MLMTLFNVINKYQMSTVKYKNIKSKSNINTPSMKVVYNRMSNILHRVIIGKGMDTFIININRISVFIYVNITFL